MIPTVVFVARPTPYLDPVPEFDPPAFTRRWRYQRDPWYGLKDIARNPRDTLEAGRGDCVDYARLAASYLYHHTDRPVGMYVCFRVHNPPGHLITTDGHTVYSLGRVHDQTPLEYGRNTGRRIMIRRSIRGDVGPRIIRP